MPVVPWVLALHQAFLSPPGEQGSCGALSHPADDIFYECVSFALLQHDTEPIASNGERKFC